jgi:hypothetical protein
MGEDEDALRERFQASPLGSRQQGGGKRPPPPPLKGDSRQQEQSGCIGGSIQGQEGDLGGGVGACTSSAQERRLLAARWEKGATAAIEGRFEAAAVRMEGALTAKEETLEMSTLEELFTSAEGFSLIATSLLPRLSYWNSPRPTHRQPAR